MEIYKDVEPLEVFAWKSENEDFDKGVNFVLEKLDALPAADVIEVVYCNNCQFINKDGFCFKNIGGIGYKKVLPTDYCSYGDAK